MKPVKRMKGVPVFFDNPTQVMYNDGWDDTEKKIMWSAGIGIRDKVYCACCGAELTVEEIDEWTEEGHPKFIFLPWVDFTYAIEMEDAVTDEED